MIYFYYIICTTKCIAIVKVWKNFRENVGRGCYAHFMQLLGEATFKTMENRNLNVSEHEKNNANGENVHNHLRRKDYAFI